MLEPNESMVRGVRMQCSLPRPRHVARVRASTHCEPMSQPLNAPHTTTRTHRLRNSGSGSMAGRSPTFAGKAVSGARAARACMRVACVRCRRRSPAQVLACGTQAGRMHPRSHALFCSLRTQRTGSRVSWMKRRSWTSTRPCPVDGRHVARPGSVPRRRCSRCPGAHIVKLQDTV